MRIADLRHRTNFLRTEVGFGDSPGVEPHRYHTLPGCNFPFLDRTIDLWSEDARTTFHKVFKYHPLVNELRERVPSGSETLLVRIRDTSRVGRVPWEGFHDFLTMHPERYVPIRMVDLGSPWRLRNFEQAMRVLLLVGHGGPRQSFNAEAVQAHLGGALAELDKGTLAYLDIKHPLPTLDLSAAPSEAWRTRVTQVRPHVVIFFGYGRYDGSPEVLVAAGDDGWMPLDRLVPLLFSEEDERPAFWLFWACSLAEEPANAEYLTNGPSVFQSLTRFGAAAVVSMRSRVGLKLSGVMLKALFQALLAGESIEAATAIARCAALDAGEDLKSRGRLDFAAPAVWSTGQPVERLSWGRPDPDTPPAIWTSLRLFRIDDAYREIATGTAAMELWAMERAQIWAKAERLLLTVGRRLGNSGLAGEALARFVQVAAAVRHEFGRPAVPVVLSVGRNFDDRLRLWAEKALGMLNPAYHSTNLAAALDDMSKAGVLGLAEPA